MGTVAVLGILSNILVLGFERSGAALAGSVMPRAYSPRATLLIGLAGIITLCLIWEVAALVLAGEHLLASPPEVVQTFIRMLHEPFAGHTLLGHLAGSATRFLAGFGLALTIGLPLGLITGFLPVADAIFSPLFNVLRYIAPIAWVPFAVLWFGTGFGGPVLIIFSGAFAACVVGAHGGAHLVSRTLVSGPTLGAGNIRILSEVPKRNAGDRFCGPTCRRKRLAVTCRCGIDRSIVWDSLHHGPWADE